MSPTTTNEKKFEVSDFSGAVQRKGTKFFRNKENNQVDLSVNASYDRIGGVEKIKGYTIKGTAIGSTDILALAPFNNAAGTEKLIAAIAATPYVYTASWASASLSLTTGTKAEMRTFLDYLFYVNGVNANYSYSGSAWSTATNLSDSPKAYFIENYNVRLYLANITIVTTAYASRVWYSDLPSADAITWGLETGSDLAQTAASAVVTSAGSVFKTRNIKVGDPFRITSGTNAGEYTVQSVDSNTQITLTEVLTNTQTDKTFWVGGNYFDVETDDGDTIQALSKNSNELLILKNNSLHRFNSRGMELRKVKDAVGTTSRRSVINIGGYTYYYHPTGIMRFDGINSIKISNAVYDFIEGVTDVNQIKVVAFKEDENTIVFFLGDVTLRDGTSITDCGLALDTDAKTWQPRSYPITIRVACNWLEGSVLKTYVGDSAGKVYQINTGNDFNGDPIPFELETKPYFPAGDDTIIDFNKLRLYIDNGYDVKVLFKLLYKPTEIEEKWINDKDWKPLQGSQRGEKSEWSFPKGSRASGVAFKFIESSTKESFLLEKFVLYYSNPATR